MKEGHHREDEATEEEGVEGTFGDNGGPESKGEVPFALEEEDAEDHHQKESQLDEEVVSEVCVQSPPEEVGDEVDAVANAAGVENADLIDHKEGNYHQEAVEKIAAAVMVEL